MKQSVRLSGALFVAVGLSACDVPTGIPRWETTWVTPGEETSVSVAEMLPGQLGVNADTSAFVLGFDPVSDSWALSEFCPSCPPITATAPKPAFSGTVSTVMPLPNDVQSIVVEGGDIDIELSNGFDFDPIRPGATADSGSITITIRSGAATVASLVIDGADQSFAPGTTLTESLSFVPSTIADDLSVELTLVSPAGDVTTLSPSDAIGVEISSGGVLVSSASVRVPTTPIPGQTTDLDLSEVDLEDRLKAGSIFLEIVNPIGVTGTLNFSVDPAGPEGPFEDSKPLAAGNSEIEFEFTETEIEAMIGEINVVSVSLTLPAGQIATVEPDDVISVTTRLRVTIEVGGSDDNENGV